MEDINESKSVEFPHEATPITQNANKANQSTNEKVNNNRSKSLQYTADILGVIMFICYGISCIAGLYYVAGLSDVDGSLTAFWFIAGVGGGFSCYIAKNLFIGLSVIAEAAEKILKQDKD